MSDQKIRFQIAADDAFSRTFANLRRDLAGLQNLGNQVGNVVGRLAPLAGLGAVAGIGGLGLAVKQLATDLNSLNDSADATGSTVEQLSGLEDIARRNGATLDLVTTSIVKMNEVLLKAQPDSSVSKALKAIGLDAAELRRQDPSDALLSIAKALAQYENDGNKARLVQQLFGKSLREVAPLLGDLAAAGTINAKVTAEQAAEAKKFTSELAALSTNASNAARALTSDMLPSINEIFTRVRTARDVFGGFGTALIQGLNVKQFSDAGEGATYYAKQVRQLQADVDRLRKGGSLFDGLNADSTQQSLDKARKFLEFYERVAVAGGKFAGGGRGFVNPALPPAPRLPDVADDTGTKRAQTEAERYLETLQRQAEGVQEITAYERVLNDIRAKRIDGLGAGVTAKQLLLAAQQVDAASRLKAETAQELDLRREILAVQQRSLDLNKLVADSRQRDINSALSLLQATPSGRRERIESDTDKVLDFARLFPDDQRIQQQASQALQQLRKDLDDIEPKTEQVATGFDKLADTIDRSMNRATSAVLDFAIDGKGDFADIGRALARDLARGLIEEPIQNEIKALGKSIANTLRDALSGKDIFSGITDFLKSMGNGGGGSDTGSFLGFIGSLFSATTTRANGGPVKAGQLVKWQENGVEYFRPDTGGTVLTEDQMRRGAAGAPPVNNTFIVNGDVSAQTVQLMQAMIERSNARLLRNMRLGGATAG